jgi:hypothetical protein
VKIVIAGGRDYRFTEADFLLLDTFLGITEVVCGCAKGADSYGRMWAQQRSIPVKEFPADWDKHGKAAGHIRNAEMADYADGAILFPGGTGTKNMKQQMIKRNKPVLEAHNEMVG